MTEVRAEFHRNPKVRPRNDAFGAIGHAIAALNAKRGAHGCECRRWAGRDLLVGSLRCHGGRIMQTLVSSADWRALRELGERARIQLTAASAAAEQVDCRERIRAGDPPAFSDGIRCTAVTAELMEYYRRQAHIMKNAGPVAVADLIEHYRRQAHAMRSAEMGIAILQFAHWLLSGLRRRLREERQQNGARSNVFACGSDE
jgi:hypothetical protein